MALVLTAAKRAGVAPAAWLGEIGVRMAESAPGPASKWGPVMQRLMGLQAELMEQRRILRNVGGNLNDVARVANSTGALDGTTEQVERLVARVVERVEETANEVRELTALARQEQLRARP